MKIKKRIEFVYFSILCLMLILCVVFYRADNGEGVLAIHNQVYAIPNGWITFDADAGEYKEVSFSSKLNVSADKLVKIQRTLGDVNDGEALCFKTDYYAIKVYVDNEEIYSFGYDENMSYGRLVGSKWNVIELSSEYSKKELIIEMQCPYERYSGEVNEIYAGASEDVHMHIILDGLFDFALGFVAVVVAVLMVVIYFIGYRLNLKQLLLVGIYVLMIGIWSIAESGILQFFTGKIFALEMIDHVVYSVIPLGLLMAILSIGLLKKYLRVLFGVASASAILVNLLQVFNILDFPQTVPITQLSLLVCSGTVVTLYRKEYAEKKTDDLVIVFGGFTIMVITAVVDIVRYYLMSSPDYGFFFRIGSLLFIILFGIWSMEHAMNTHKENVKREAYVTMAYTDELTGLNNRRAFDEELRSLEINRKGAVIVMIDLNNLKKINDTRGHQAGDIAIKTVADKLKKFVDVYGETCYRTGGDEFCAICKKLTINEIIAVCEDANIQLKYANVIDGLTLSMAYGYKIYDPGKRDSIEQVVSQADEQMYAKKLKMKKAMNQDGTLSGNEIDKSDDKEDNIIEKQDNIEES